MKQKTFAIIAILGAGCILCSSCSSNRNSNSDRTPSDTTIEEPVTEEVQEPEVHAYGCAFDGLTNIYKEPSNSSEILGKLRNGSEHVVVLSKSDEWVEVKFCDQTGYIHESFLSETPSKAVTIDVDAQWLEGVWSDSGFQYVLLFPDGKMCIEHQYSTLNYGKWHLEGNEIILTMVADVDTGFDLSYPIGTELRYTVNPNEGTLGNGSGYEMVKWDLTDIIEEGEAGLTTSDFQTLRKRTDKYVN